MTTQNNKVLFHEAQFYNEYKRCEYCEEKPCLDQCPASVSPTDFIRAAAIAESSDFKRAAALIMQMNPFGGVCGVVCPVRHCMSGCIRKDMDTSINIPSMQAYIIQKAHEMKSFPKFNFSMSKNKKIAVIGAGPAGLSASLVLASFGYEIDVFEKNQQPGGFINLIPDFRLPRDIIMRDINFILSAPNISIHYDKEKNNTEELIKQGYNAVLVTVGLWSPLKLSIETEDLSISATDYLLDPHKYNMKDQDVAVIGGGAVAADAAVTAKKQGAQNVQLFALESLGELLMEEKEIQELIDESINIQTRTRLCRILSSRGMISGIQTSRVTLKAGEEFSIKNVCDLTESKSIHTGVTQVIIAIGNKSNFKKCKKDGVFYAGDYVNGPTTVVEAVASGKNEALKMDAFLSKKKSPAVRDSLKSNVIIQGYNFIPVSLESDFFGRTIETPFLLSAAPPSDGYEQMKKAYKAGWSGGIMKTAFDNVPIHIPSEYMFAFNDKTYANCDNVSGHSLSRVCEEVKKLIKEFPDKLTMVSTGGPVTGDDKEDKKGWQSNTKKLEQSGVMGIEYSLSCPQGGDGTEGDIVSQNAVLTAKIIDWILEAGDASIPKLFKLTGAVTSIEVIVMAIKEVLKKYPKKKAGITLANTFPTLTFQEAEKRKWEKGVVVGMSGDGVTPISYLSLAKAVPIGVEISGNGGPMDHKSAAHFLALGVKTVQFCTMIMKYGYNVFSDLTSGVSHLMEARGLKSMKELIGVCQPDTITDFMDLSPVKKISDVNEELCIHCGNCTRCPYLAITLNNKKIPETDASKCIGCSICTQKCPSLALFMRDRTKKETDILKED